MLKIMRGLAKTIFALTMLAGVCEASDMQAVSSASQDSGGQKITLGDVQSKIKVGVTGDDVIAALGSPNIITSGDSGTETWVYDKLHIEQKSMALAHETETETQRTLKTGGITTTSEKTMIVVIKFDSNKKVSGVQYRQSTY